MGNIFINRQLDTSDVVSRIQIFSGNNLSSFRLWMKHLRREALEKQPIDDQYMQQLVARTVKESAADFWYRPATIKDIRELSENIAAIALNFRKAQGQYNTAHNIGQQNTKPKHISMTHNSNIQQNNKYVYIYVYFILTWYAVIL